MLVWEELNTIKRGLGETQKHKDIKEKERQWEVIIWKMWRGKREGKKKDRKR